MTENYRALSWDDKFIPRERIEEVDSFTLLPEGEYSFIVEGIERKMHQPKPGGKLPACNIAVVRLRIDSDARKATVLHRLYLHEKMYGALDEFFSAVGMSDSSGLRIEWDNLPGATGRCKIRHREYDGKTYLECAAFLPSMKRTSPPVTEEDIPF